MPWKGEKDAYKIWISEIILQQTRVLQGISYYNKFLEKFPDVKTLAEASEAEVFKVWEGLGYYSRCKNILHTARHIVNNLDGVFPRDYHNILALKGIGPYTASAISSFAYGLPHAVVDGNVLRVLSRYFGEATPIDSSQGSAIFNKLADLALDKKDPASYNQAIMDFGATICKPRIAECTHCMLQKKCIAFKTGQVNKLPVKAKKLARSCRWLYYFIFIVGDHVLVNKRVGNDIWQNLHEFYLYEAYESTKWDEVKVELWLKEQLGIKNYFLKHSSATYSQQLTHQSLQGQLFVIQLQKVPKSLQHFESIKLKDILLLAFPKFINTYLEKHPLPL
jgi:A/G-specific adenine glycosylase